MNFAVQDAVLQLNECIVKCQHFSNFEYVKGKAVPLQASSGSDFSRKLRFPDFMTTAQDGSKVVSLTHRPPSTLGNAPCTHFC